MSALVISLDFELCWGMTDCPDPLRLGRHVEGEWLAVPELLELFKRYRVQATWATVGMAMCRDWRQWQEIRPLQLPGYRDARLSNYRHGELARAYPRLFFGRPLVERILDTPGQELASHSYSHFYCNAEGASPEQFAADLACARAIAAPLGARLVSLVFPRNQMNAACLRQLPLAGMRVFRGNRDHWLYRDGHDVAGGMLGRAARLADSWLALSSPVTRATALENGLVDVPASLFLRPWSAPLSGLEAMRIARLRAAMSAAARSDGLFHLWWHPYNFGLNRERNLAMLESLLQHHALLRERHGMASLCMSAFAQSQDGATPGRA
jgi:peptidoglycan/xylan/chitin deacetylase (PgdA/CDA1 family)